jgi:hypothetical protein
MSHWVQPAIHQVATGKRARDRVVPWSILALVVIGLVVVAMGELTEQSMRQRLVGSTWQMTSYNYVVSDGQNGDHRSDSIAIADPERYSLAFVADGTAVLTADCYRSVWGYTVDYGVGTGLVFGTVHSRFTLLQDAEVVPACEPARVPALDVTKPNTGECEVTNLPDGRFFCLGSEVPLRTYLARTEGLELRSGALVLLRPLSASWPGSYADKRPLEQVFVAVPRG